MGIPGFPSMPFGPFVKGAIDGANPLLSLQGSGRYLRNAYLSGAGRLMARPGTQLAMTLMDDQGSPAACTSVAALTAFGDGALAVGHSTVTSRFYLYWLNDSLTDWYNISKVVQGSLTPAPIAVLWSSASAVKDVTIAEGLGFAYIAHNDPSTTFNTKQFDSTQTPGVVSNYTADLRGSGAENTYFRGVVSFQQSLWGWGYGSQAANDNDRPELLRFSPPFFAAMQQNDNFGVGHRVRSQRERVVAAVVAGQVLYVGTGYSLWPVTGFGRDSWDKSRPLDDSYGFAGLKSAVAARNGWLYYWSNRGPMRVFQMQQPEPLFDLLPVTSLSVVNAKDIVATFDPDRNQVMWLYQDGTSGRVSRLAAYDVMKDVLLGPDGDIGMGMRVAALIQPVLAPGPTGPPTGASTTNIGASVAKANWTNGEAAAGTVTVIEYRIQGGTAWTVASSSIQAGVVSYQLTGLAAATAYEWRVKHLRNGQSSAYLGPAAATQFTTVAALLPPTNVAMTVHLIGGD